MWVDRLESFLTKLNEWTKLHRNAVHGGIGLAILFYGSSFTNLVLFSHSLAVAGLPILRQHGKELMDTYVRTRNAIKSQTPLLLDEGKQAEDHVRKLISLKSKLEAAKRDYDEGRMSQEEWQSISKDLNAEITAVNHLMSSVSNSLSVIGAAVDPKSLQGVISQVYSAILSHIAATSHETIKAVTLGLSVGNIVGERLANVVQSISRSVKSKNTNAQLVVSDEQLGKWTVAAIHGGSRAIGIALSFFLERMAATFSGCVLGAQMVMHALENVLDPFLEGAKLPTFAKNPELVTTMQMSLVGFGFMSQLKNGRHLPELVKILLMPLFALDYAVTAAFVLKK